MGLIKFREALLIGKTHYEYLGYLEGSIISKVFIRV